jgi:DNA sulfur modification protein DndC
MEAKIMLKTKVSNANQLDLFVDHSLPDFAPYSHVTNQHKESVQIGAGLDESLSEAIASILTEMRDEYLQPHDHPWIIGFSGGKDSTLVAHLVFEMLLSLAPDERRRAVHIVSNDTLVESPAVIAHLTAVQAEMEAAARAWQLPVTVVTTKPKADSTFWVNLIGRGYPTPNRFFRWCTDRMKIRPTTHYILNQVAASGEVILLLGVRRDESAARAKSVSRYDNGSRLHPHNDLKNCFVFRPIVELSTEDVWEFLSVAPPPWGGSHKALIKLYRDAGGGECPVVTSKDDAPSCGTSSSRFGCWTCTVVAKDRSMEGFVESGFKEFIPLLDFRDWLISIRNDPARRMLKKRKGQFVLSRKGEPVLGAFTLETRREILERLLDLQITAKRILISDEEIQQIRKIWAETVAVSDGSVK